MPCMAMHVHGALARPSHSPRPEHRLTTSVQDKRKPFHGYMELRCVISTTVESHSQNVHVHIDMISGMREAAGKGVLNSLSRFKCRDWSIDV